MFDQENLLSGKAAGGGGERSEPQPPAERKRPSSEVLAKPRRRQFSATYKQQILAQVERLKGDTGAIGALIRREGLYASHVSNWRRQTREGGQLALVEQTARRRPKERKRIKGPVKWTYFYLYVILDIFSRFVVGWVEFRTFKYHPTIPDRLASHNHGLDVCRSFFAWYNFEHRHSGISYLTPAVVHRDQTQAAVAERQRALAAAYAAHPQRFVRGLPKTKQSPQEVKKSGSTRRLPKPYLQSRPAAQTEYVMFTNFSYPVVSVLLTNTDSSGLSDPLFFAKKLQVILLACSTILPYNGRRFFRTVTAARNRSR